MPMPDKFYLDFESSFLGPTVARTLPALYDVTAPVHPKSPDFMGKVEKTLLQKPTNLSNEDRESYLKSREELYKVIFQLDKFFGPKS